MPRLSLYNPVKGNNYRFIDRTISQMFQVGGTDVYCHVYLGTLAPEEGSAAIPTHEKLDVTNIQDMLFLENRDRKYDQEIYKIRGIYNVQNVDFNLSQFGLFVDNDTLHITVHINDFINTIGRKPISGDVMEFPHLKDEYALNDHDVSMPRYYVVEDVSRASEGFSATWYPHLYRLKLKKMSDSQQFADILDQPASETSDISLRDLLSTYNNDLAISDAVVAEAEEDTPRSGYETRQFYTLARDDRGLPILTTDPITGETKHAVPLRSGYNGYLLGDGYPPNGYPFGIGYQFPENPVNDDFYLRTDLHPNRLYRFNGAKWIKVEDAVRHILTNYDNRQTLKTSFINNSEYTYGKIVDTSYINLTEEQTVIDSELLFQESLYVVLKLQTPYIAGIELAYAVSDHPAVLSEYLDEQFVQRVRITLPIINDVQQAIPVTGTWRIQLSNDREKFLQDISKALKPKRRVKQNKPQADF